MSLLGFVKDWLALFDSLLSHYQQQGFRSNIPQHLVNANAEWFQERNEFWATYVQVLIAVVSIIVLAILLVAKANSAEAGLPIFSAVSGFAIARSSSTNRVGAVTVTGQREIDALAAE